MKVKQIGLRTLELGRIRGREGGGREGGDKGIREEGEMVKEADLLGEQWLLRTIQSGQFWWKFLGTVKGKPHSQAGKWMV